MRKKSLPGKIKCIASFFCLWAMAAALQAEISVNPSVLDITLNPPTDAVQEVITIVNSGPYQVNYSLDLENLSANITYIPYVWRDSDHSNGPVYEWNEISSTGTRLGISGEDDGYETVTLPFDFPFYGGCLFSGKIRNVYHLFDKITIPEGSRL